MHTVTPRTGETPAAARPVPLPRKCPPLDLSPEGWREFWEQADALIAARRAGRGLPPLPPR